MRARIAVLALTLAGCGAAHEVQLTIALDDSVSYGVGNEIRTLQIGVGGVESGSYSYPIDRQLSDRKTTWLYESKTDGALVFAVTARGAGNAFIASGSSRVVTSGGSTASATIHLSTVDNAPNKHRLGETCTAGVDVCASGYCVDGVCCNSTCDGACNTCNGTTPGTCQPALPGTNPRKACRVDPQAPCAFDGTCDGTGKCRVPPAGAVCTPASCENGTLTVERLCDGHGFCGGPAPTRDCAPYACTTQGNACATICTTTSGCAESVTCNFGRCGLVGLGAQCVADGDCSAGTCVDGFCCDSACTGGCMSCKEPGQEGHCVPRTAGQKDLHGMCVDAGTASCVQDGTCNANGHCAIYPAGTICLPGGCSADGGTANSAAVCQGDGFGCPPPVVTDCGPYACAMDGAPGCYTSCGDCSFYASGKGPPLDAQCAAGKSCVDACTSDAAAFVCQ